MLTAQFAIVTVLLLPYLSVAARQSREYYSDECSPSCQVGWWSLWSSLSSQKVRSIWVWVVQSEWTMSNIIIITVQRLNNKLNNFTLQGVEMPGFSEINSKMLGYQDNKDPFTGLRPMSQYFLFQFRTIILCFFKMILINQLQTTNYWALIALLNVCNNLDYDSKLSLANGHSLEHSFEYKIIYSLNV